MAKKYPQTTAFEEGYKLDPFWITSTLDSWWANHEPRAIIGDATRIYQQWPIDVNLIQCPVWIYHGDKDHDVREY
jgi:pimeloyl-ACP methyl ester carboxylesterase